MKRHTKSHLSFHCVTMWHACVCVCASSTCIMVIDHVRFGSRSFLPGFGRGCRSAMRWPTRAGKNTGGRAAMSELHRKGHMTTGHRLFCKEFLCFNTMPCRHMPLLVQFRSCGGCDLTLLAHLPSSRKGDFEHALGCDSLLGFLSRRHFLLHKDLTPALFLSGFPLLSLTTFSDGCLPRFEGTPRIALVFKAECLSLSPP